MTLQERLQAQLDEFASVCPDWDLTIELQSVQPSNRGLGPGLSLYTWTADGMGFEVPLLPGDDLAGALGESLH